jgi:hypothetical protein
MPLSDIATAVAARATVREEAAALDVAKTVELCTAWTRGTKGPAPLLTWRQFRITFA